MNLLPFESVTMCPACHLDLFESAPVITFSTERVIHAHGGRFVSVHQVGDATTPHLEKHCPRCGYGWLEQTAEPSLPPVSTQENPQ